MPGIVPEIICLISKTLHQCPIRKVEPKMVELPKVVPVELLFEFVLNEQIGDVS